MTTQNGSLVLLKIGYGVCPEQYVTIGGMRTTRFLLNNQLIDSSHKGIRQMASSADWCWNKCG